MSLFFNVNGTVKEVNGWAGEGGSGGGSDKPDMMLIPVGDGLEVETYGNLMNAIKALSVSFDGPYALNANKISPATKLAIVSYAQVKDKSENLIDVIKYINRVPVLYATMAEIDNGGNDDTPETGAIGIVSFDSFPVYNMEGGNLFLNAVHLQTGSEVACKEIISTSSTALDVRDIYENTISDDGYWGGLDNSCYAVILYNGVGTLKDIEDAIKKLDNNESSNDEEPGELTPITPEP